MITVLVCFALLSLCFATKRYVGLSIQRTPFFVLSSIIVVLYAFAYFSLLSLGVYAIIIIGLIAFPVMLIYLIRADRDVLLSYLTPGFMFWLALVSVSAFIVSFSSFSVWDEFMHWAPLAKVMSIRADMLYGDFPMVHKSYPPGARLFYMLFLLPAGFDEGRAYIAQTLILFSPLAVVFRWESWVKWRRAALFGIAIFLSIYFLVGLWVPVNTLYLDAPVAFFIAATYLFYYRSQRKVLDIVLLSPLVFALLLLKSQLFPFVLLVLALIFLDLLIRRELTIKKMGALYFVFVMAFLSLWSWQTYLEMMGVPLEWSSAGISNIIVMYNAIQNPAYSDALLALKASAATQFPLCVLLIYISVLLPFLMKPGIQRWSWWISSGLWFLGLCLYLYALVGFSLIMFSGYYGDSFSRYSAIYYLAWSAFVLDGACVVLYSMTFTLSQRLKRCLFSLLCISAVVFLFFSFFKHVHFVEQGMSPHHLRQQVSIIASRVKKLTPPSSKVFIVWQNSFGLGRTMLSYDLFPRGYNYVPTAFGIVSPGEEGWKAELTPNGFLERLQGFDYLLVAHDDPYFWDQYGDFLQDSVPLVSYEYCEGSAFDSALKEGCVLSRYNVYLFNIQREGDMLHFINITDGDNGWLY